MEVAQPFSNKSVHSVGVGCHNFQHVTENKINFYFYLEISNCSWCVGVCAVRVFIQILIYIYGLQLNGNVCLKCDKLSEIPAAAATQKHGITNGYAHINEH